MNSLTRRIPAAITALVLVCTFGSLTFAQAQGVVTAELQHDVTLERNADDASTCNSSQTLTETFASGARWELCWHVAADTGLEIHRLGYAAPGDSLRQVAGRLSLAQLTLKYDIDALAQEALSATPGARLQPLPLSADACPDTAEQLSTPDGTSQLCRSQHDLNALTHTRERFTTRRNAVRLFADFQWQQLLLRQWFELTEDGNITMELLVGGSWNRATADSAFGSAPVPNASNENLYAATALLQTTWRLDIDLHDSPEDDRVEEFNFALNSSSSARRAMTITPLETETATSVQPEHFRGWRISDTQGGYYLDPQAAGYRWPLSQDWRQFDLHVSRARDCERLASRNRHVDAACADDLDSITNNESLAGADPVLWYSVVRRIAPTSSDFPALGLRRFRVTLIPFDWTSDSPFATELREP